MCIYIYVCKYIYIYTYICMWNYIYTHIYVYIIPFQLAGPWGAWLWRNPQGEVPMHVSTKFGSAFQSRILHTTKLATFFSRKFPLIPTIHAAKSNVKHVNAPMLITFDVQLPEHSWRSFLLSDSAEFFVLTMYNAFQVWKTPPKSQAPVIDFVA